MTTGRGFFRIDVFLATIYHPSLVELAAEVDGITMDGCLRVANYRHVFRSRGFDFVPSLFGVKRPKASDRRGRLELSMLNVDKRVREAIDGLKGKAELTLEQVYADSPDELRNEWVRWRLSTVQAPGGRILATFSPPNTEGPFMGLGVRPGTHPAAFA